LLRWCRSCLLGCRLRFLGFLLRTSCRLLLLTLMLDFCLLRIGLERLQRLTFQVASGCRRSGRSSAVEVSERLDL
jgi:hypothetical protein